MFLCVSLCVWFVRIGNRWEVANLLVCYICCGAAGAAACRATCGIVSTDEDLSLRIESSAIINLRGVSTKLNKYIVFTMQTYKKLIKAIVVAYNFIVTILVIVFKINLYAARGPRNQTGYF